MIPGVRHGRFGYTRAHNGHHRGHALVIRADQAYRFTMDNTQLSAAIRRLFLIAAGERVPINDEPDASLEGDISTVLAALSAPPAEDVREALIDAMIDVEVAGGMVEFGKDDRSEAAYLADAILSDPRLEVRPRGTVTDCSTDVNRHL